jgi:hypothetical protein
MFTQYIMPMENQNMEELSHDGRHVSKTDGLVGYSSLQIIFTFHVWMIMHDDYLEISATGELPCLSIPQPLGPKSTPKVNTLESFPTKKHTEYISPRSQISPKSEVKNQKFETEVFLKVFNWQK